MTEAEFQQLKKQNPQIRIKGEGGAGSGGVKLTRVGVKGIIRQSSKGPNKTEARFELERLRPMRCAGEIGEYFFEDMTLRLANGLRYTPDYVTVNAAGTTVLFDVKGAWIEEDAIVKIKAAAAKFKHYEFWICQWKEGTWTDQQVLP